MAKKAKRYALGEAVGPKKLDTGQDNPKIDPNSPSAIKNTAYWAAKRKRAAAKTARAGTQAQRQSSRSPGGWAGGGSIENYNDQVKRKYGGGKL